MLSVPMRGVICLGIALFPMLIIGGVSNYYARLALENRIGQGFSSLSQESMKKIDMRVKAVDVPEQKSITNDNVSVLVNAVIYYRVQEADKAFIEAYQLMAGFPPPPRAVLAYDATNVLLDSIEQAMITNDQWITDYPDRNEVRKGINHVQRQGITGQIRFDTNGRRIDAPVWLYEISNSSYPGTLVAP